MSQQQTITVKSVFTRDILIPFKEGDTECFECNIYGEYGKFIAEAQLVDQETKQIKRLRFESKLLTEKDFTTEKWQAFEKAVEGLVKQHVHEFANYSTSPIPRIELAL